MCFVSFEKQEQRKKLREALEKIKSRTNNFDVPLKKISILMYSSVMRNFAEQGRPAKWKPLSLLTLLLRKKGTSGNSPRILEDSGMLRGSIIPQLEKTGENSFEARVGTNIPYAKTHQFGGMSTANLVENIRRKLPQTYQGNPINETTLKKRRNRKYTKNYDVKVKAHQIPARPFLMFQTEDKINIADILRNWVFEYVS